MERDLAGERVRWIERHISERTWGRVDQLAVEVIDGQVRVRGRTRTYYLKQLAIQACLEVLGTPSPVGLEVDIEVTDAAPVLAS
jgi:hypothetical protein